MHVRTSQLKSSAIDVSQDGSYVLGWTNAFSDGAGRAVRWDAQGKLERIPAPRTETSQTGTNITPTAISADGRVIVGTMRFSEGRAPSAWIWDEANGAPELILALQDAPDLGNWRIETADAVSADGTIITGTGAHRGQTVAYIARIAR